MSGAQIEYARGYRSAGICPRVYVQRVNVRMPGQYVHTVNDRLSPRGLISPRGLFVKMTFWGLFSKFDLLISSPVPSQGVSQYLIIDKHYMYLCFV